MTAPTITDAALEEMEARANAATPGPWHDLHDGSRGQHVGVGGFASSRRCDCGQVWSRAVDWAVAFCDTTQDGEGPNGRARMANATFIAHARQDVPVLIAALRAERETVARLRVDRMRQADDVEAMADGLAAHACDSAHEAERLFAADRFRDYAVELRLLADTAADNAGTGEVEHG